MAKNKAVADASRAKKRVSQTDVPAFSLSQAIRVPQTIADNFALHPARPLLVAQGMNTQPTSGGFRMMCGASIAYGLTEGGYNAPQISLTPLGRRIVAPTKEGDDALAQREALLQPRVLREFLRRYDGSKIPREDIACNVLAEMGVPREAVKRTLDLVLDSAKSVGFIRDINGVPYVDLQGTPALEMARVTKSDDDPQNDDLAADVMDIEQLDDGHITPSVPLLPAVSSNIARPKVFISHSKNMEIVAQIKTMLNVAEVEYEIAVEQETTAKPVPEKVLSAMRNCTAAVICVTLDGLADPAVPLTINQNVLIEIGAAFVLYDQRVILMWDKRVPVPSNLQGLYRCEFEGSELSWSVGMKLMEAIKRFKGN